jgi:hypothetical protein
MGTAGGLAAEHYIVKKFRHCKRPLSVVYFIVGGTTAYGSEVNMAISRDERAVARIITGIVMYPLIAVAAIVGFVLAAAVVALFVKLVLIIMSLM